MKSKAEIKQRLRRLAKQLEAAEGSYMESIGCGDERHNLMRCRRLAIRIAELEWVLQPRPVSKRQKAKKAKPSVLTPEQQRDQQEYGALCNPKRFGE